jgi:hypothetical protein
VTKSFFYGGNFDRVREVQGVLRIGSPCAKYSQESTSGEASRCRRRLIPSVDEQLQASLDARALGIEDDPLGSEAVFL